MAKLEGNAFGGFSGRLGNLVGYSWKGVWCVRVRPAVVRNPRSAAQQRNRAMFAEEVRLAGRMGWVLNTGLAAVSDELHMTPQNVFVKANQQAFSASDNGLAVDWSELIVSAGPVAPVAVNEAVVDDRNVLNVSFEKNPMRMRASSTDMVHLYVYCPAINEGYLAAPVYRHKGRVALLLEDDFTGQEIHIYMFVSNEQGLCSETAYGGTLTVVAGAVAELPWSEEPDDNTQASWPVTQQLAADDAAFTPTTGNDPPPLI